MCSSPALMPQLGAELTPQKNMEMSKGPFYTGHADFNDDNEDTMTWDKFLSRKGSEDPKDGIHLKMVETETPKIAEAKPQANNVV